MKPILPKGTVAVRCFDDVKNVKSILTPPGATLLVIPSSSNKCNGSIFNNVKVLPPTSILTLPYPLSTSTSKVDKDHRTNKKILGTLAKVKPVTNVKSRITNVTPENMKKIKKLKPNRKLCKIKQSINDCKTMVANPLKDFSNTEDLKTNASTIMSRDHKNNQQSTVSKPDDHIERHAKEKSSFHSPDRTLEHESPSDKSKLFYFENDSQAFYANSNSENSVSESPQQIEMLSLKVGSPPSYEAHVCNSSSKPATEENSEASCSRLNTEAVSSSYNQSLPNSDISMYMFPSSSSYSLPSNRIENSNMNYYSHDHFHYNNNNPGSNFSQASTPAHSNPLNYYYESPVPVHDYDMESKQPHSFLNGNPSTAKEHKPQALNFEPNSWSFANYDDDEPRDYSSNSTTHSYLHKRAVENLDYIESFVESAKRQNLLMEENESSYEERRRLASSLLNTTDTESKRKKALKENFWIVEDEPLEESIFLKSDAANSQVARTDKPVRVKPKPSREYICHICGRMLKGRSSLRSHIHLHMNVKPYECQYCSRKFTQSSVLRNHVRIHTGETPYSCYLCGKSFKTLSILRKHLTKHSKIRAFKCCVCSKAFKSKPDLQTHLKIHIAGPHLCRICSKLFDTRRSLAAHVQRKHKSHKKFFCTICNKGYSLKCLLKQHMNVHSNEHKHSCYVCGAAYVWKSGLAAHLRTHSFRIQCEVCGVKFISLKKLEKHRGRHAEPFPHKCSKCERQFKFSYLLKKHLAKHRDELACTECGVGFMTKTKLRKHLKVHSQNQTS